MEKPARDGAEARAGEREIERAQAAAPEDPGSGAGGGVAGG